eukprot:3665101-Rhodomonas_salina.1
MATRSMVFMNPGRAETPHVQRTHTRAHRVDEACSRSRQQRPPSARAHTQRRSIVLMNAAARDRKKALPAHTQMREDDRVDGPWATRQREERRGEPCSFAAHQTHAGRAWTGLDA